MHKLLIVDDNPRDQKFIREVLDWESMGIDIVGTCFNGRQALEQLQDLQPDIVLSDITMPGMSGIKLASLIKEATPDIKVVFMSCHDEFHFAQSALQVEAENYILKPILPEQLESAIKKVLNKVELEDHQRIEKRRMIEQLNQSLPYVQEQFMRELVFGYYRNLEDVHARMDFLKLGHLKAAGAVCVAAAEISDYDRIASDMKTDDKYLTSFTIKNMVNLHNNSRLAILSLQLSDKEFLLIVFGLEPAACGEELLDAIIAVKEQVEEQLKLSIRVGVSEVADHPLELPQLYNQAMDVMHAKFYSEESTLLLYQDIKSLQANRFDKIIDSQVLHKEIKDLLSYGNEERIWEFANKYIGDEHGVYTENYIKGLAFSVTNTIQLILLEANESLLTIYADETHVWQKLSAFKSVREVKQWLIGMLRTVKEHQSEHNQTQNQKIVESIKAIIHDRYHESLTVVDIAKTVYLSDVYANKLFKKTVGKTIFDYLTEYRLEVAKQLLKDPYSRVYLVAEQTGYTNKSHFCLLFKKHTGLTPTEYKGKVLM